MQGFTRHHLSFRNPATTVYSLVVAISLLLINLPAAALEPVNTSRAGDSLPLGSYIEHLRDPGQAMSLPEVRARSEQFRPHDSEVLNIGYTSAGHWVRFRLTNPATEPLTRYLEFRSLFADRLTLYQPRAGGEYKKTESGRLVPPPEHPYLTRNFVFPITLPPESDHNYYRAILQRGTSLSPGPR